MSDRGLVLALVLATLALLVAATVSGSGVLGWAAVALFLATIAAYVRWRLGRRRS